MSIFMGTLDLVLVSLDKLDLPYKRQRLSVRQALVVRQDPYRAWLTL